MVVGLWCMCRHARTHAHARTYTCMHMYALVRERDGRVVSDAGGGPRDDHAGALVLRSGWLRCMRGIHHVCVRVRSKAHTQAIRREPCVSRVCTCVHGPRGADTRYHALRKDRKTITYVWPYLMDGVLPPRENLDAHGGERGQQREQEKGAHGCVGLGCGGCRACR